MAKGGGRQRQRACPPSQKLAGPLSLMELESIRNPAYHMHAASCTKLQVFVSPLRPPPLSPPLPSGLH